jgi:N-ethylmaleimide reductase
VDAAAPDSDVLLSPVKLGDLELRNRIVMAPMTRVRSDVRGFHTANAPLYYEQRASAGLIVTEGVTISPTAVGNPNLPGIWHDEHVAMWRRVTDRVHAVGGSIVLQLWHTGRSSHRSVQPGGVLPVSASAVAINGMTFATEGRVPFEAPRELGRDEIPGLVQDYADAAARAIAAGFDGVEIHGANGYLPDQFLHASSNLRTDDYGGSVQNRARFMVEVVEAVADAAGARRTGLRISPSSTFLDMHDPDPAGLYGHLLERLRPLDLAYLHVIEPGIEGGGPSGKPVECALGSGWVRERWQGGLVAAGDYNRATAIEVLRAQQVDAVAFGRPFISNPDLVRRLVEDLPLEPAVREVFYGGSDAGYVDYPTWDQSQGRVQLDDARSDA